MAVISSSLVFYYLVLFSFSVHPGFSVKPDHGDQRFVSKFGIKNSPALYIFGDSLVDCGNNNNLPTISKSNFLPYGIDFEGGIPTGRATNGKTMADFIAINLGLPMVPPFMGLSELQRSNIKTGINYASGGCGILPYSPENILDICFPFDNQTEMFQTTVQVDLPKQFMKQQELQKHLAESLFFISAGANDYRRHCFAKKNCSAKPFAQYLLNEFSLRLKRLYNLGARKFLVINIPAAGCIPSYAIKTKPKCNMEINDGFKFYNNKLTGMLQQLQSELPGSAFALSDTYKFLLELKERGQKYGINDTSNPCCPENYDGKSHCLPFTVPCKRRETHLFFDEGHPTQIVNDIFVRKCFNQLSICSPLPN